GEREGPSAQRWEGEGLTSLKLFQNRLDDAVRVREHVVAPEPQHPPAPLFEPGRTRPISLIIGVLTAIGLDDQAISRAREIHNETADRKLPAKAVPLKRRSRSAAQSRRSASVAACGNSGAGSFGISVL